MRTITIIKDYEEYWRCVWECEHTDLHYDETSYSTERCPSRYVAHTSDKLPYGWGARIDQNGGYIAIRCPKHADELRVEERKPTPPVDKVPPRPAHRAQPLRKQRDVSPQRRDYFPSDLID